MDKDLFAFWRWLHAAYRDGEIGDEARFTKWNMEVAYRAGYDAALADSKTEP